MKYKIIAWLAVGAVGFFPAARAKNSVPAPPGMVFTGVNKSGFREFRNKKDGSVLVEIPAGGFMMGSADGDSNALPVHPVDLDTYYFGKFAVTNRQYKKFCDASRRPYPADPENKEVKNYFRAFPDHPVVGVSWADARAYCEWAGLRLPTEAEWEKAARGTDGRRYPWGNGPPGAGGPPEKGGYRCNYWNANTISGNPNGVRFTSPVGAYEPGKSPCGCFDMAGNVWTWCGDWFRENYYAASPRKNPLGPEMGDGKVIRGGSYENGERTIRSANRGFVESSYKGHDVGFRVAFGASGHKN